VRTGDAIDGYREKREERRRGGREREREGERESEADAIYRTISGVVRNCRRV
jgi:hypothetical protein